MANVYSVEQVNKYIKNIFQTDPLMSKISVQGEVSNCKYHSSGHIYFTIKDQGNTLSAIMFAGNRQNLKFKMDDGMQIIATGNISIYEQSGKYQLYVRQVEKAGNGALYEKFLALKKELEEMGMFDHSFKQKIPIQPMKLGVATAATGAAVQDIINVARRRNPYIQIVLYSTLVQGDGATESICNAIQALDQYGVDTIIIGRGGGSIEDLWAFNEEKVARAIFECKTPIISAVGHETDVTISDFVADLRAATPSAAAELAVADIYGIINQIKEYEISLNKNLHNKIELYRQKIQLYNVKIGYLSPLNIINNQKLKSDELVDSLQRHMYEIIKNKQNYLSILCAKLEGQSPLAKLSSGYSYAVKDTGENVSSIKDVEVGNNIDIHVKDGWIKTEVIEKNKIERL